MLARKKLTQLMLAALVAASTGAAYATESCSLSVDDVTYWRPSLHGGSDMRIPNSSTIDLKKDLGLDKENSLNFTIKFKSSNKTSWYISSESLDFKSSSTLTKSLTFNNSGYLSGDKTNSELKLSHYQVGLRNGKEKHNSIFYTNLQLNHSSIKTTISNSTTAVSQTRDKHFTTLGLGLGWETTNPGKINFFAEINPLSLGNGSYWEHKIGIKVPICKNTNFTLGYKAEGYRAGKDKGDDRTRIDLRGMYFGLGGRF